MQQGSEIKGKNWEDLALKWAGKERESTYQQNTLNGYINK